MSKPIKVSEETHEILSFASSITGKRIKTIVDDLVKKYKKELGK